MLARGWLLLIILSVFGLSALSYGQQERRLPPEPLEAPPLLESTDLFLTVAEGFPNVLEADIFPHYIVALAFRCNDVPPRSLDGYTPPRWRAAPCISMTPAVRLRMLRTNSNPVYAPSFMPRVNFQWLFHDGTGRQSHVYGQIGHHSNGQAGCLYIWTGLDREDPERCVRHATDPRTQAPKGTDAFVREYYRRSADVEELSSAPGELCDRATDLPRGHVAVDVCGGNFSLNYWRIGYDMARYGHHSWRWGVRYEHRPARWMDGPLREFYPKWRLGVIVGRSFPKPCARFDVLGDVGLHESASVHTDWVSIEVRALCMFGESRGLGLFARYYKGQDYYNASFLEPLNRLHVGVAINHWRAFGAG